MLCITSGREIWTPYRVITSRMTDTWGRRLFIAGAVFLLLIGLVHSLSLFEKPVPANDTEAQLVGLMNSYKFNLMGSLRSMADLMRGFSISFMLAAIGLAAFDLLLCRERPGLLKRIALINAIWLAAMTVVSLNYFFAAPTSFLVIALLIFGSAWLKLPGSRDEMNS
jgi:MFS family permease